MSDRDELHRIVDELPEAALDAAERLLVSLRDRAFDEDLSAEETLQSERAWNQYLSGEDPGETLEEVKRELLG